MKGTDQNAESGGEVAALHKTHWEMVPARQLLETCTLWFVTCFVSFSHVCHYFAEVGLLGASC